MKRWGGNYSEWDDNEADELDVTTCVKLQTTHCKWRIRNKLKTAAARLGVARNTKERNMRYAQLCKRQSEFSNKTHKTSKNISAPSLFQAEDSSECPVWTCHKFNPTYKVDSRSTCVSKKKKPYATSHRAPSDTDSDDISFAWRFPHRFSALDRTKYRRKDTQADEMQNFLLSRDADLYSEYDESEGASETPSVEEEVNPRGRHHVKQSQATQSLRMKVRSNMDVVKKSRRKKKGKKHKTS